MEIQEKGIKQLNRTLKRDLRPSQIRTCEEKRRRTKTQKNAKTNAPRHLGHEFHSAALRELLSLRGPQCQGPNLSEGPPDELGPSQILGVGIGRRNQTHHQSKAWLKEPEKKIPIFTAQCSLKENHEKQGTGAQDGPLGRVVQQLTS